MKASSWLAKCATSCAALALALAGLYPGDNPDTFGHLAQGRQIAELGRVPSVDTWSLLPAPPRAWHNYEWLSDLGTYLLFEHVGYEAVTLFKCALLAFTAWCLGRFAREFGGARAEVLTSLTVISTIPALRIRLSDRPHVLGICFAAAYLLLLSLLTRAELEKRQRNLLIGAVATLHLIWINAHGSHLLGLMITVSFLIFVGRALRPLFALVLGLEFAASCISPYGPAIVLDAIAHVGDSRYRGLITEWQPWRESDPAWLQLGPVAQSAVLALLAPRLLRMHAALRAALLVAGLLAIANFRSVRFVAEFLLLSAPLAGIGLASLCNALTQRSFAWLSNGVALLLAPTVVLGAAALPPDHGVGLGISYAQLPSASADVLGRFGRSPRVFAAMQDAWFTMFAAKNARFVIDGRAPFYGPAYVRKVGRAMDNRAEFERLVREYDVNVFIVNHAAVEERSFAEFARATGFALVLIEDLHALYVRRDALTDAGFAQFPGLRALTPSYRIDWLFKADARERSNIASELTKLAPLPGAAAYRGWVEGVLTLAPLKRGGASDGFRWPQTDAEWSAYRAAYPQITRAAARVPFLPVVSALHAQLAAVLCDFPAAERSLTQALKEQASREPLLAAQELALRRGAVEEVRAVVTQARALPEGRGDPWLAELTRGLASPPRCPSSKEP